MATTGTSYFAIVACLLLYFASQSIDASDFHFDVRSCDSLLPQTHALTPGRQNDPSQKSQSPLVESNKDPPYKIDISRPAFSEKDKLFTVTLQGNEFNGFILQARALRGSKQKSVDLGRFIDLPPGVEILQCGTSGSSHSANTVISTDTSLKKSVKLTWKSLSGHVKNMLFVATFVKNNTYWPNVKTNPLQYQTSPDFNICGTATSCYRYSGTSEACAEDKCNFLFISELGDGQVSFILGGVLTEPTGYIGVAFTNEKSGKLDIYACVLETKEHAESKYYGAKDIESQPKEQPLIQTFHSSDVNYKTRQIECSFIRDLQIPGPLQSDLTQPQTMMFLRGPLTNSSADGDLLLQLGNSSVFAQHPWSATVMVDISVTVNGVSRREPLIGLAFVSIAVTLFHAAAN